MIVVLYDSYSSDISVLPIEYQLPPYNKKRLEVNDGQHNESILK